MEEGHLLLLFLLMTQMYPQTCPASKRKTTELPFPVDEWRKSPENENG